MKNSEKIENFSDFEHFCEKWLKKGKKRGPKNDPFWTILDPQKRGVQKRVDFSYFPAPFGVKKRVKMAIFGIRPKGISSILVENGLFCKKGASRMGVFSISAFANFFGVPPKKGLFLGFFGNSMK